jgi:undecaprenyl-diphosphatase
MAATHDATDGVFDSDIIDDPAGPWSTAPDRAEAQAAAERRRNWGRQAALATVALSAIGGFYAISRTIGDTDGNRFDRALVRRVGRVRSPVLNAIARGVTSLGGVTCAVGVALFAVASARRRPRLATQIAVGSLGGVAAELCLKRLFKRERPALLVHLDKVSSSSFPSGHSMASSSLYLTLAFVASRSRRLQDLRGLSLGTAGALAGAIGATRVYLGVHWPTDVLAGLALGTAWACATEAAFDLSGADRVERAGQGT